jgi:cellulose 1,4-beta-cellobiosidase
MRLRARPSMRRLRRTITLAVAALLAASGLAVAGGAGAVPAVAATSSCTAAYSVTTDWGSGFTASLTITDSGTAAITGWTVTYSYAGNQALSSGWNGTWTQSGKAVTVASLSYNGNLAAGASTTAGANFNYSGTNAAPTSVTCTPAGGTTGGGSITATPASFNVTQGGTGTFTLALSSAPASNVTVSIAATGNAGLTGAPASLTFTPSNYSTAQTVTVTANSSGTGATTFTATASGYTAATVTATEVTGSTGGGSITATPTSLNVTQGSTGTFTLALSSAPASNVTVSIAATGNAGLTGAPASLTFTPSNYSTAQTVTVTANSSGTGATTFTATASGYTAATVTATEVTGSTGGSCGSGITLQANPGTMSLAQGKTGVLGVSLSASPSAGIAVSVARTSGNTGLSVASGSPVTLSSSNWNLPQPVYITADSSSTGAATFTISATGCTSVTVTVTETAAGSTTTPSHVTNPFTGSTWYVNPDYTAEVATSASGASGTLQAQMTYIGTQPTFIWLDHIGAIYGGSDNASGAGGTGRMSLTAQLQNAVSKASGSTPEIFPIVIYDLPDRDCDALASNGELSIANNGLSYYEHSYIDPIAQILTEYEHTNLRVVAVIEPDSLPNLVTNSSVTNCASANSSGVYTSGIEYALNKLHAIPNVYNYMDIAHSAWLGWPANMTPAVSLFKQVASATTAGVSSVDGFISDTANTIPVHEPYLTATETEDGNPVDSVQYYSYDPYIDEFTYDQAMYSNLVSAGFPSTVGMLIDTSRDGWGDPSLRPTGACPNNISSSCTTTAAFVNASKVDERPFRGDWCNPENAGIGAVPQANPDSTFPNLYAYVWVKPPGESDGTYPAYSGTGDPHCDPNGTQTDGSGNTYPTDAIPDSPPAGHWFPVEFQQLVQDAYPAIP